MQDTPLDFAAALRDLMQRRRLTGPELAARIGCSHQAVYTWINRQALPSRLAAVGMARALRWPALVEIIERDRTARPAKLPGAGAGKAVAS